VAEPKNKRVKRWIRGGGSRGGGLLRHKFGLWFQKLRTLQRVAMQGHCFFRDDVPPPAGFEVS
jgi:hypothetical protein